MWKDSSYLAELGVLGFIFQKRVGQTTAYPKQSLFDNWAQALQLAIRA